MESKYQSYKDIIREKLSDYRYIHSVEVAASAVYLAEKYGGDKEKMYLAGLLHDILKEASREDTFHYINKYNMNLTPLESVTPKLWHAMVGAEYIKNELGIDDEEIIFFNRYESIFASLFFHTLIQ